jgi:DNA polymerase II small subunit/DNA polymerase delta subunit B
MYVQVHVNVHQNSGSFAQVPDRLSINVQDHSFRSVLILDTKKGSKNCLEHFFGHFKKTFYVFNNYLF